MSINVRKHIRNFIAVSLLSAISLVAVAADDHPAQDLVVKSTTSLLNVLKTKSEQAKSDPVFLKEQVTKYVVPHVDFDAMTKLAVGKAWRKADASQRVELVAEFKSLLLNQYTNTLTEYSGETIVFQPFKPERRDDRAEVRSSFNRANNSPIPVLYKLRDRNKDDGWLIYDIEVNQISLITSFRTAFANEIEKSGIDGLINTMKERNAES